MALRNWLWVAMGGALGAVGRYLVSTAAVRWWGASYAWGTLLVNWGGCLLIGYGFAVGIERGGLTPSARLLLLTGFLGGLTTFSTYSIETLQLFLEGRFRLAATNVVANNVGGLLMTALGMWLGRL